MNVLILLKPILATPISFPRKHYFCIIHINLCLKIQWKNITTKLKSFTNVFVFVYWPIYILVWLDNRKFNVNKAKSYFCWRIHNLGCFMATSAVLNSAKCFLPQSLYFVYLKPKFFRDLKLPKFETLLHYSKLMLISITLKLLEKYLKLLRNVSSTCRSKRFSTFTIILRGTRFTTQILDPDDCSNGDPVEQ